MAPLLIYLLVTYSLVNCGLFFSFLQCVTIIIRVERIVHLHHDVSLGVRRRL
jgi:hypothetical protein